MATVATLSAAVDGGGFMGERTDQERGTEPETTDDWVRDLEGDSDVPGSQDAGMTPETTSETGEGDPAQGTGGARG